MAFEELDSPITEIKPEDQPDIMHYSLLRNFVADLKPRGTSPGMDMWSEFRFRWTKETNYARWSRLIELNGEAHIVALYGVQGELPNGKSYMHSALRCSCCLPDYKSFRDFDEEYQECPAQNLVIDERVEIYKKMVGGDEIGAFDDESLLKVTVFLLDLVNRNTLAWPPSHRSDRLLIDPLAKVFGITRERMRAGAQELARDDVVQIHGEAHPSISIAT